MNTIAELNEQQIFVAITKEESEFLMEETNFFKSKEFRSNKVNHVGFLKHGDILYEMDKECYELLKEIITNSNYDPKREIFKKIEETLGDEERYFKRFADHRKQLIMQRNRLFDKLSESERKEIIAKMHTKLKDRDWHYVFIDKIMQTLEEDPEGAKSVLYNEKVPISPDEEEIDDEVEEHDCENCLFTSVCDKSKKSDKDDNDFDTEETAKEILRRLGVPKSNIHVIDLSEESEEERKERKHKEFQEILDRMIKIGHETLPPRPRL